MYSLKVLLEADLEDKDPDRNKDVTSGLENDEPLTEVFINRIKGIIASKLNSLNDNNLDDRLGRLNLNNLKNIGKIAVKGKYYIDPAQVKSGQSKGASAYDIVKFREIQLVPFFVYNDEGDNFNAENAHDSYNLLFVVPAMDVEIDEKNMKEHENLFSKQKGFAIQKKYESLSASQVAAFKIKDDELSKFMKATFISANTSPTASIIASQPSRRSSPQTESLSIGRNKENIVDNYNIIKTYNNNSHRKNSSMNDIFSGKLSNYLFEDNQNEKPNVSVSGKTDALQDLKSANKFADSFDTTGKSITTITSAFEQKGLVPAIDVKKIASNENSLQIIPFIKKDEQDILAVEKNKVQQVVLEIIPIPNIKINEKNKEFFQAFFGIEGELPKEGLTYKSSDIDAFKTVFLPVKKDQDLKTSIKKLETAILSGNSNLLLKLANASKQGTISTNPTTQQQSQQKEQEVQSESFVHTQGNLSSLLFETRLNKDNFDKYLKDEVLNKASQNLPKKLISSFKSALEQNMPGASEVQAVNIYLKSTLEDIKNDSQNYDDINGTNINSLSRNKKKTLVSTLNQMLSVSQEIFEQKKAEEAGDGKRDETLESETGLVIVTPTESTKEVTSDNVPSAGGDAIESETEEERTQEASAEGNFPENITNISSIINKDNIENSLALFAAIYKKLKGEDLTGEIYFKKLYRNFARVLHSDRNVFGSGGEHLFRFITSLEDYITKTYDGSENYNVIVEGVDKENKLIRISKDLAEKYLQKLSSGGNISIDNDNDDVKAEKLSAEGAEVLVEVIFSMFEKSAKDVKEYINTITERRELVRFIKEDFQIFSEVFLLYVGKLENLQEEFNIESVKTNLGKIFSLYEETRDLLNKKSNELLNSEEQEKVEEIIDDQKENTTLVKSDVDEQKEKILSSPEIIKLSREKRAYIADLLSKPLDLKLRKIDSDRRAEMRKKRREVHNNIDSPRAAEELDASDLQYDFSGIDFSEDADLTAGAERLNAWLEGIPNDNTFSDSDFDESFKDLQTSLEEEGFEFPEPFDTDTVFGDNENLARQAKREPKIFGRAVADGVKSIFRSVTPEEEEKAGQQEIERERASETQQAERLSKLVDKEKSNIAKYNQKVDDLISSGGVESKIEEKVRDIKQNPESIDNISEPTFKTLTTKDFVQFIRNSGSIEETLETMVSKKVMNVKLKSALEKLRGVAKEKSDRDASFAPEGLAGMDLSVFETQLTNIDPIAGTLLSVYLSKNDVFGNKMKGTGKSSKEIVALLDQAIEKTNKSISTFDKEILKFIQDEEVLKTFIKKDKVRKQTKSSIKGSISKSYNNMISKESLDGIFDRLEKSKSGSMKKIFATLENILPESFVYKAGILLLAENELTKEKINIQEIFSEIFNTLNDSDIFDASITTLKQKIEEFKNTKMTSASSGADPQATAFEYLKKLINVSRPRFDDMWTGNEDTIDYKMDMSKTCAYYICKNILENASDFLETGIEITGELKKLDDIRMNGGNILYSEKTYNRLAQELKKSGSDIKNFNRNDLNKQLDESVKKVILDIAIAQHMRYDEDLKAVVKPKIEKWRKSDEMSQKDHDKIKGGIGDGKNNRNYAAGGAGLIGAVLGGFIGGPIGSVLLSAAIGGVSGAIVGRSVTKDSDEEKFTSRKDIWANEDEVKQSADKLFEVVTSLAADIKDIYLESKTSYIKGSLTGLLFENLLLEADAKELTYEDIRKTLKSNDILAFGFPDVENRKEAEVSLIESVGGMLEDTFDIKIKGIKNGAAALAMERLTSSVDKSAEKGKPAVEEISEMTAGAGVPQNMNAGMTPEQFMMMMNMTGGPMMMMFMQMMMQQQFQQQMAQMFEQMQKGKVSGSEAAKTVEKASGGKISELDKALNEAISQVRVNLPKLKKADARRIILMLSNAKNIKVIKDYINGLDNIMAAKIATPAKIKKYILDNFNITENESDPDRVVMAKISLHALIEYTNDADTKTTLSDKSRMADESDQQIDKFLNILRARLVMGNKFNNDTIDSHLKALIKKNNSLGSKEQEIKASYVKAMNSLEEKSDESRVRNDLFVGRLTERLFESDNSQNKVLSKNKPIKNASYNSEYLQTEMKRIWKI